MMRFCVRAGFGARLHLATLLALLIGPSLALAHVTVKPGEAGLASYQTFTVSVPVEKDLPTTGLRLLLPEGLSSVIPNAKAGWTISVKVLPANPASPPAADGERPRRQVTEIIWSGGSIPAGQRDDFAFSAKLPATASTLVWKAYQQYQDGSELAWDRDPKEPAPKTASGRSDFSKFGPYSTTRVVNDLNTDKTWTAQLPLWLSLAALLVSLTSLLMVWLSRRRASAS